MLDVLFQSLDILISERAVNESLYWIDHFIKTTQINDRDIHSEEYNPAFMHYSAPAKKFCKDMNKNYIHTCEALESVNKFIGETYDEPTYFSSSVSKFLGFGANTLAGFGVLGATCQLATDKMVEPMLRKAQYYLCEDAKKFVAPEFVDDFEFIVFEEEKPNNLEDVNMSNTKTREYMPNHTALDAQEDGNADMSLSEESDKSSMSISDEEEYSDDINEMKVRRHKLSL